MTDCKEIDRIIHLKEGETLNYEFKSSLILQNRHWKEKVLKELIAFANLNGGKLYIGINNNREIEGRIKLNFEQFKEDLDNIIQSKISPILSYNVKILDCKGSDIIVIKVDKKKDIPHAFIVSRNGPEIKNRIYYIRTPYGKRLVSDNQLKYLFNEEALNLVYPFTILIIFQTPDFILPYDIDLPSGINRYLFHVKYMLPRDFRKILKDKGGSFDDLFYEMVAYSLLYSIISNLSISWDINFLDPFNSDVITVNRETPKEYFKKEDIPGPMEDSALAMLSIDANKIAEQFLGKGFFLPPDTKIEINNRPGSLKIYSDLFEFNLAFHAMSGGIGMGGHPEVGRYMTRSPLASQETFKSMRLSYIYNANIKLPYQNIDYFTSYIQLMKNIKIILERDWNYEYYAKSLPHRMIYNIDEKLNQLLEKKEKE